MFYYNYTIQLDESDLKRKEVLRHRVNDYIRRAETLKAHAFIDGNNKKRPAPENKGNSSLLQRIPSLEKSSAFTYNELRLYRYVCWNFQNKMLILNEMLYTVLCYSRLLFFIRVIS